MRKGPHRHATAGEVAQARWEILWPTSRAALLKEAWAEAAVENLARSRRNRVLKNATISAHGFPPVAMFHGVGGDQVPSARGVPCRIREADTPGWHWVEFLAGGEPFIVPPRSRVWLR